MRTLIIIAASGLSSFGAIEKPLAIETIAYLGGAYTPDGEHFVFAQFPKAGSSEIKVCNTRNGKIRSLGKLELITPEPEHKDFPYSMAVLASENDLSVVYVCQYGEDINLNPKKALAWDVKTGAVVPAKNRNLIEAQIKKRSQPAAGVSLALQDKDAKAVQLRKQYQPLKNVPNLVGKKLLSVGLPEDLKVKADVTEAFREVYSKVVVDYPNNAMPKFDSGGVLCDDKVIYVAMSGKWLLVKCSVYAHYGVRGFGYESLTAVNCATGETHSFPAIEAYAASGDNVDPRNPNPAPKPNMDAFFIAPDGNSVAWISGNRLTLYRLHEKPSTLTEKLPKIPRA